MELNYQPSQRLVLELLCNQVFEGDCVKCTKNRVDVINVLAYPNRQELGGRLSFYSCELQSVRVLNGVDTDNSFESDLSTSNSSDDVPIRTAIKPNQCIAIPRDEYERLLTMTQEYIYMPTIDDRYVKAVSHLYNCETIGVHGINCRNGRSKPITLLVMCSWDQVYIFDLCLFRKKTFEPELKDILESSKIKKVVHNSRKLVDCLWHCHKVKLNNIFDTAAAGFKLEKKQIGETPVIFQTISESLERFLNFPSTFLENALEVTDSEWQERPILPSKKIMAARLAAFLIVLKNKQETLLLEDYYNFVRVFSELDVNADRYTAATSGDNEKIVPEVMKDL